MEEGRKERREGRRHDRKIKSGWTGRTDGKKEGRMEGERGRNIWKRKRRKDGKKKESWIELSRIQTKKAALQGFKKRQGKGHEERMKLKNLNEKKEGRNQE